MVLRNEARYIGEHGIGLPGLLHQYLVGDLLEATVPRESFNSWVTGML